MKKELEDVCKSIDETADKLRTDFLIEKNDQIQSCTKDIYEWIYNNASLTIRDVNRGSEFEIFLKNYKHLTENDIRIILNRLVEKKHILRTTVNKPYEQTVDTYKFNLNV